MKKNQLFLLHFAGGSCYSFQFLTPLLNDFDVVIPELPGRGRRIKEQLLKDFDLAAENIFNQIIMKLGASDFLVYGHSMGAYLGLRVARLLQNSGRQPAYLIVSGNAGPGVQNATHRKMYLLENKELLKELHKLGGIPAEILEDEELFAFFEPILRADFEIVEKNELINEPPLKIPLYALMGSQEEQAQQVSNWSRFTELSFKYEILEGDHFFIYNHSARIAALFKECMRKLL